MRFCKFTFLETTIFVVTWSILLKPRLWSKRWRTCMWEPVPWFGKTWSQTSSSFHYCTPRRGEPLWVFTHPVKPYRTVYSRKSWRPDPMSYRKSHAFPERSVYWQGGGRGRRVWGQLFVSPSPSEVLRRVEVLTNIRINRYSTFDRECDYLFGM